MDYKSALKAAIDGEKVRCKNWGGGKEYIHLDNKGNFKYCRNGFDEELFGAVVDYKNDTWEIVRPETKFKPGDVFYHTFNNNNDIGIVIGVSSYYENPSRCSYKVNYKYGEEGIADEKYMVKING